MEPAARASVLEFVVAAFGEHAADARFRHVVYTAMDAIRGIPLMSLSDEDTSKMHKRRRWAKADILALMNAVLTAESR